MMLSPFEISALLLSLKVAMVSVFLSLPFAIGLAYLLARRDFFGKSLVDSLIHLPLILPPVAVGYVLLILLGRQGFLGAWLFDNFGISLAFTWKAAAIASAVMAFPLMVRAIRLSLESMDTRLLWAATSLGAGRWRRFATITLPLIRPGILTGAILGFARSLGEFGATISFAANIPGETQTLPLALYAVMQSPDGGASALRLVLISTLLAITAMVLSSWLAKRIAHRKGAAHG